MLTREQILNPKRGRFEDVPVPEWDGHVRLKALSVRDRAIIETEFVRLGRLAREQSPDYVSAMRNMQLQLVALSVVDEAGAHQFTLDDVDQLSHQEPEAIGRLADAATLLNGFQAKATEEAAKN